MTDDRSTASAYEPAPSRRGRIARRVAVGLGLAALLGVIAVPVTNAISDQPTCEADTPTLSVVVAPELARIVTGIPSGADPGACRQPLQVVAKDPAAVATSLREATDDPPDVWIPDSSIWLDHVGQTVTGSAVRHVASSPLVLAVPSKVQAALGRGGRTVEVVSLLPRTAGARGPVRWVLPHPDQGVATVGAVLALEQALGARADRNALLSTVIRGSRDAVVGRQLAADADAGLATPMSEQQLTAYNRDRSTEQLVAVAPGAQGALFDYPFVVLTTDPARTAAADQLFAALQGETGRRLLDEAGFGAVERGVDRTAARQARDAYVKVLRPSRLLAVLDVSGSMRTEVPGTGGATRLQLAAQAAVNGLAVYPDETEVGLWMFSTNLTPTTDYRELAPLAPLSRGADGVSGRERVAVALSQLTVQKGWTGLYDTTLAAVRQLRKTWSPDHANSVVLITDGGDSDRRGITIEQLVRTLAAENDPARPVAVFSIAYGPDADVKNLQRLSAAVGGRAYAAPDPRMIGQVLRDAVGRRACAPTC